MATQGASRVVTAVFSDDELRKKLVDAQSPEDRRSILDESGLLAGLTEDDFESLRQLAGDQEALSQEVLASVSGGNNTTEASYLNGPGYPMPTANAGGATIAGDVVVGASSAATSAAMGTAAVAVVVGGAIFGF